MFRCCITFLAIVGFLTNHLVVMVPHAHAGMTAEEQKEHDATPHFHCGHTCQRNKSHSHSHGKVDHAQTENQGKGSGKPQNPGDLDDQLLIFTGLEHDADAIFLPVTAGVPSILCHQELTLSLWHFVPMLSFSSSYDEPWTNSTASSFWQVPAKVLDASDTYLTLRNLRI